MTGGVDALGAAPDSRGRKHKHQAEDTTIDDGMPMKCP